MCFDRNIQSLITLIGDVISQSSALMFGLTQSLDLRLEPLDSLPRTCVCFVDTVKPSCCGKFYGIAIKPYVGEAGKWQLVGLLASKTSVAKFQSPPSDQTDQK